MSLVKFNRNTGMDHWFNDRFNSFFNEPVFADRFISRIPAVNISETPDAYHIELAAPGLEKEDFKINLDEDLLTVSAEQKSTSESEDKRYSKREYSYTSFTRSFSLPDGIDPTNIDAIYQDGVLTLKVAKKEEAKQASRAIEVK